MNQRLASSDWRNPLLAATAQSAADRRFAALASQMSYWTKVGEICSRAAARRAVDFSASHGQRLRAALTALAAIAGEPKDGGAARAGRFDALDYALDWTQRLALYLDTLRQRGDAFFEHEAAGCPPILAYDYEVALDGRTLPRPCNYQLLRIKPPADVAIFPWKRPYVIIDPRAGHGAGIGCSKADSQVGVALKDGHPVYFVSFLRSPEPGQTLADVSRAEAAFVRFVEAEHPDAPKPVVVGNCQGGWATLVLGAANPDLTGPLVLNGAPVATWSGDVGVNSMRYGAGLSGGQIVPMMLSDLGDGVFDGAWLVFNFKTFNPGRTWFRKYYDLFDKVDTERDRFLEFEKWWGGFFLLNEQEIVWIVRELFVGNSLARNEARLEHGRVLDVKQIRSPIIVFASRGDSITPVKQAVNWIIDAYADESEIRIRGQRIVYMVHEKVGHLGIFVSSSIAKREHAQVGSTLKTIEALAPGLYEMTIEDMVGEGHDARFTVSFAERKISDLPGFSDGRADEAPFAAVQHLSELQAELYDVFARPFVQACVTRETAELGRALHPLRLQRALFSSRNPFMAPVPLLAGLAGAARRPVAEDNPWRRGESVLANAVEQVMDLGRDLRCAFDETMFYGVYATPYMRWFGRNYNFERARKSKEELLGLPEVRSALMHVESGGFIEAVVRMLILLAAARGEVRRDRLERSSRVLSSDEPFRSLSAERRAQIIHEQSLIVEYAGEAALTSLSALLHTPEERLKAAEVAQYIPGELEEMEPSTLATLQRFRQILGLPPATVDVERDPLAPLGEAAQ